MRTKHAKWNPEFMPPGTSDLLFARDRPAQPWPNGNGSTTQVAIHPVAATTKDFDWRVSIATVDNESQFSRFDEVDRWLMPLSPSGMTLRVEGETTWLPGREAFAFGGEASIHAAKVRESSLDLNLMVRRGTGRGSLLALVAHGKTAIAAATSEFVVIVVLEGTPSVDYTRLDVLDAIELRPDSGVVVMGDAVLAIARITRTG
jgi:environmental stress-induced protein Ves